MKRIRLAGQHRHAILVTDRIRLQQLLERFRLRDSSVLILDSRDTILLGGPCRHSAHLLTEFDIPIRDVEEVPPGIMNLCTERDLHERTPLRTLRLTDQAHSSFQRRPVGLPRVTRNAGTHDVFPGGPDRPIPRDHVVEVQVLALKHRPQNWQVFLSRSKMLCRVNLTSFFGRRSNTIRRITRGTRC